MDMNAYRISIRGIEITTDTNYAVSDGSVTYLGITHDYRERKMPIIQIGIELDISVIGKLYDYKDTNGRIKLTVSESRMDSNEIPLETSIIFNRSFSYIPLWDKTKYVTSEDSVTTASLDPMKRIQQFECYLIDIDAINWFNMQISLISTNVDKADLLQAMFQMRNVPAKKVIATPPMDDYTISQAVLPYADMIGNINMINSRYGLYNTGALVYYDMVYLYCVNPITPNIVMPSVVDYSEIVIMLQNINTADTLVEGSYNDIATRTHYINVRQDPSVYDYNDRVTSTKFSTVTSVDSDGNVKKTTLDNNSSAMSYIYEYNSLTTRQYVNSNIYGRVVELNVNGSAITFLRPYKRISFQSGTQYITYGLDKNPFRLNGWNVWVSREGTGPSSRYIHNVILKLYEVTTNI